MTDAPGPIKPIAIEYAHPTPIVEHTRIERDGDTQTILIPPEAPGRLVLLVAARPSTLLPALALAMYLIALSPVGKAIVDMSDAAAPLVLLALVLLTVFRVVVAGSLAVRILRRGRRPTEIRTSPRHLRVVTPVNWHRGQREWPTSDIVDLSIREVGSLRALARLVELQIVLSEERVYAVIIPVRPGEPLAYIEDNLRDALGLRTGGPSPGER